MSNYRIPDQAYRDPRLSGTPLRVLMDLEERGYSKGHAWPAQGTIAANIGVVRETVNRAVKVLEDCGYLVKAGRRYRACHYYMTVPTSCDDSVTGSCDAGVTQTPKREHSPSSLPPSRGKEDAASADADKSPERRRKRRKERRDGRTAVPPAPRPPSPVAVEGGAMVPADIAGASKGLARQVGQRMNRATAPPRGPPDPVMTAADHLSRDRWMDLVDRSLEIKDPGAACVEFGLTEEGKPKCHD